MEEFCYYRKILWYTHLKLKNAVRDISFEKINHPPYNPVILDSLLKTVSKEGHQCLGYADDLASITRGRFAGIVLQQSQTALNMMNNCCNKERLSIKAQNTTIVPF